jgi:DnaJ-class molecular chaperone
MADPYSILGVPRDADEKAIKSAYRKLAKELHPDKNTDNPKATERFSAATQAYDILSDKAKRAAFDRGELDGDGNPRSPFGGGGFGGGGFHPGAGGGSQFDFGEGGIDLGDIFGSVFGGGRGPGGPGGQTRRPSPPPKGANVAYRLKVPFVDVATGAAQRVTLSDGGSIDMKLPAGVEHGQQVRLSGKGQAGPGGNGDAMVTIEIVGHPFFVRDGADIRLDLPITLKEAALGGKIKVPTVDGPVMVTIPANASSGRVLRLKGKGFIAKTGTRGDQLVRLMIHLPDGGDAALTQFAEGWTPAGDVRANLGV